MFLNFESNPDLPDGSGNLTTGIQIGADDLLVWDEWSAPARTFIQRSGRFLDVRGIAEAYTDKITSFHNWLQQELNRFHANDLNELRILQALMPGPATLESRPVAAAMKTQQRAADELEQPFCLTDHRAQMLDVAATKLTEQIGEIRIPNISGEGFASERPVKNIADRDIIGTPRLWDTDVSGHRVFVFIQRDGLLFGLDERAFAELQDLVDSVLQSEWARRTLSRSFITKVVVDWLHGRFQGTESRSLSEAVSTISRDAVRPLQLWAPIANLEIQTQFSMGPVTIAPMTKAMIDEQELLATADASGQRESIVRLFNELRRDMQGLAAVVFRADYELGKIKEDGRAIAEIVVGLLRFLSPAAIGFPMVCANALLGAEVVPSSHSLISRRENLLL